MASPDLINTLPDELLFLIFGRVSLEDRVNDVQVVCKRWRRLCKHPSLWENIEGVGFEKVLRLLDACSNPEQVLSVTIRCPRRRSEPSNRLLEETVCAFERRSPSLIGLRSLKVKYYWSTEMAARMVASFCRYCPALRALQVGHKHRKDSPDLKFDAEILQAINHGRHLEFLNLYSVWMLLGHTGLTERLHGLKSLAVRLIAGHGTSELLSKLSPNLQMLELDIACTSSPLCALTSSLRAGLSNCVARQAQLQVLTLTFSLPPDVISTMTRKTPYLRELTVRVSPEAGQALVLTNLPSLKRLTLLAATLSDLKVTISSTSCPSLRALVLEQTRQGQGRSQQQDPGPLERLAVTYGPDPGSHSDSDSDPTIGPRGLEELRLSKAPCPGDVIAQLLRQFPGLRTLSVSHVSCSQPLVVDAPILEHAEVLVQPSAANETLSFTCPRLKSLRTGFSNACIGMKDGTVGLKLHCPKLESLHIQEVALPPSSACLSLSRRHLPKLEALELTGVRGYNTLMLDLPNLRTLHVSRAPDLSSFVLKAPVLQHVTLDTVPHILRGDLNIRHCCPSLRALELIKCAVDGSLNLCAGDSLRWLLMKECPGPQPLILSQIPQVELSFEPVIIVPPLCSVSSGSAEGRFEGFHTSLVRRHSASALE